MLKADFYHVQSGTRGGFKALVFQGSNIIDELHADTEKAAHAIAREVYPEALTPAQMDRQLDEQYNSPEGKRYRARQDNTR